MSAPDRMDERLRALGLVETQRMAEALFAGTAARGLWRRAAVNARRATGSGTWRGNCSARPRARPGRSYARARAPCSRTARRPRTG
ncbi:MULTISPECIES: hypothetical protein [Streptomyces]|uniref:Uncharacterized protein n=1 Tax=Streptomyces spororaveus TaxID=284039 RepID=A0ABQ3T580_9ACTN|nr:hypothetical protein [Streptomyces spororaveus]GHI75519.1 hypothetical protein Sspor_10800 [Streptomyces spororaveus]